MTKSHIRKSIKLLHAKNGRAPGYKALSAIGISEDHIWEHWDFLSEALQEALGDEWQRRSFLDIDEPEEEAPVGHNRFSVYVVNLDADVNEVGRFAKANPRGTKSCLYVGSTWHSPEQRLSNHLRGHKGSRLVRKYAKGLNESLTLREAYPARVEAEREELRYALELRRKGYRVWQH